MKIKLLVLSAAVLLAACDNHQQPVAYVAPAPQVQYVQQPTVVVQQSNSGDALLAGALAGYATAALIHGSNGRDYGYDHGRYYYYNGGQRYYDPAPPPNVRTTVVNNVTTINHIHPSPAAVSNATSASPNLTKPPVTGPTTVAAPIRGSSAQTTSTFQPAAARPAPTPAPVARPVFQPSSARPAVTVASRPSFSPTSARHK